MQSQMLIQMHDNEEMTQFPAKTNLSPPIHQTHIDAHHNLRLWEMETFHS